MDEEYFAGQRRYWMYRSAIDRSKWHCWTRNVHVGWDWVVDDFGNLVKP